MPKLVDYSVRFAFLREAAFEVVLRHGEGGLAALSRRSIAAALGTSVNTVRRLLAAEADLTTLAADEVERRRRWGRWGHPRDAEPMVLAMYQLRTCVPDTEQRIAEELVWLRLVLATTPVPEDRDRDGLLLRQRFSIYEQQEEQAVPPHAPSPSTTALAPYVAEREAMVSAMVASAMTALACDAADQDACEQDFRTTLAGLTLRVCLGDLEPEAAVVALTHTVNRWAPARVTE